MKAGKFWTHWPGIARLAKVAVALFCFSLAISAALAQVRNSTITGTVTDQNGAVLPKALVTVTNQLTNESVKTQSGPVGDYAVPYLGAGRYAVLIDAPGFKAYRVADVEVDTGVTVQVNAKLAVGGTNQVIQVTGSTAELQTESSAVTGSVATQEISNLPNINNDPLYYATLSAGVTPSPVMYNAENLGVGFSDRQQYSAIRVNGGMLGTDDVQLDGVPVQGSGWHETTVVPNRDALQEVTVAANDLSADLGGGQAIIQMVTKSGTNDFHGDLYYNLRNEQLNANSFGNILQGIPRAKYRVDEAGGSFGGPVSLPKLFNGKDKVFFFVAYDRLWNTEPASGYATVPTDLQRQGDFSATLINSNGTPMPATLYNPFSVTALGNGVYERAPYPAGTNSANCSSYGCGSVVTNPDQYGLKYLQAFPEPNHKPSDVYGDNNYFYSGTAPTTRNSLNTRMDFHFGKNSFYLSGGLQNGSSPAVNSWGNSSPWIWVANWSSNYHDENPYAAIGDIITLSPSTFIDLHAGFQRVNAQADFPNKDTFSASDYSAYGMPTGVQSMIALPGVAPSVYSLGYGAAYSQTLNNTQWDWKNEHQDNFDYSGSITKVIGRWTLKEGVDERIFFSNWADIEWATPSLGAYSTECYCEQYAYSNGNGDGSLLVNPQQSGAQQAMAPIGVMGYRLDPGTTPKPALATKSLSLYTQNDWKATNRLTINLGLRYEVQPGPTERHNHEYDVDTTVASPFLSSSLLTNGNLNLATMSPQAGMGAFAFSGVDGYSRHMWATQYNNISPRLGAAYRLNDLTVLRGGFGRIYAPSNTGFNANGTIYGGGAFAGGTEMTPYGMSYNGQPGGVGDTGDGRFEDQADTQLVLAPGPVQSPSLYGNENGGAGVDYFLRKGYQNAYFDQWNAFVERRMHGWIASVGYIGSKGTHLPWRQFPLNGAFQIPNDTLMSWRTTWLSSSGTNDPSQAQVPNPMPALFGLATGASGASTITAEQASEGYLDMLGQTVLKSAGSSLFNSLDLQLKHSYSTGLTAQFIYDWSRTTGISGGAGNSTYAESQQGTLAAGGGINYADLQSNKGLLGYDVPQRFVGVVTYLTQWGRGGRYELGNPIGRAVAGGWQLGTVVTVQSGQPWGPNCGSSSLNSNCIPTGQPLQVPKALQHWYDGSTTVTLPDGHQFTPNQYTYLKWNPDAFTSQIVQFPNGQYAVDQYWLGTSKMFENNLRLPAFKDVNFNITRQIPITERYRFELLGEFTNLFNHQNLLPGAIGSGNNSVSPMLSPSSLPTGAAIGENGNGGFGMSPDFMDPRQITLTARFTF
jgi:hypothetical protein